jgi:hypothetical protein
LTREKKNSKSLIYLILKLHVENVKKNPFSSSFTDEEIGEKGFGCCDRLEHKNLYFLMSKNVVDNLEREH